MTELTVRPATTEETESWLAGWRTRWEAEYARTNSEANTDRMLQRRADSPDAIVLRLLDGGEPVGILALSTRTDFGAPSAVLDDVYVEEHFRRRGIGTAAVRLAQDWARERAMRIRARTDGVSPAQLGLVRAWTLGGQSMVKNLTPSGLELPPGVAVRSTQQSEFDSWYPRLVEGYGQSFVDAGLLSPEEARVRAEEQTAELLTDGLATEGHEFVTLLDRGEPVGEIWLRHGLEPGMSYVFDVEVHADQRGKGYGRALMIAGEAASLAAGSERLGLHVFGHNTVARRLYEKLAYQTIDQSWSLALS
jgi:ribosomal protein S18 acetylase RimI-like enzyme